MSKGGSKTRTTNSVSQYMLPSWLEQSSQNTLQTVTDFTAPFLAQAPTRAVAGISPLQQQSYALAQQMAMTPAPAVDPGAFSALAAFAAPQIETPRIAAPGAISAAGVSAQRFTDANIDAYLNPYRRSVVDDALSRLAGENDRVTSQLNAKAAAAQAFGGSRHAVQSAEQARDYLQTAAQTANTLNAQAFEAARQTIASDQDRALQAAVQSAQMAQQVAILQKQQEMQAATANQEAALRTLLANQAAQQATADFRLSALSEARDTQLAGDASQRATMGLINQLGTQQQAQEQRELDVPWQMLDRRISAASDLPHGYTISGNSTEKQTSTGGGLLGLASGLVNVNTGIGTFLDPKSGFLGQLLKQIT